ncbi:respiratory chain complex I subunit 1 family protein [Oceanirhabdus seepicola]|uniref:NADH-quinone oxidoreductase subunit H n=1 Tax=Oceanirhabdus seepicola TaxID=2828781 RepID=A0A9J6P7R2_9CLOT|nr:complex I subunit 1 family protein [Oceanirhabdus seepicola]MCM1992691.1 NADH-quinone oxidoreductase subunit H [Oceanirhabdus seepicola]
MSFELINIFHLLVFPGFLFCFAFGLLLAGIDRKLVARMQRRIGPPLLQPLYDFFKLIGKESIVPRKASKSVFLIAPIIGLLSIVIIPLFVPIFGTEFVENSADLIVILYLLTAPAVAIILGGSASGSPYAGIGISREMVTMLSYELPLVLIFLAVGSRVGHDFNVASNITFSLTDINSYQAMKGMLLFDWKMIPAAVAFLLCIPAEVGTVPFDTAEAETEICEGPLVEYSGAYLGIYKLTSSIKMFVMGGIFVTLFLGGAGFSNLPLNIILFMLLIILVIVISVSFLRAIVARIKIEQTIKFFWTIPTLLGLISLVLTYI